MAIGGAELKWFSRAGQPIPDGALNFMFAAGRVGDGPAYSLIELRNENSFLTLTGVKAWIAQGSSGAVLTLALVPLPNGLSTWSSDSPWPAVNEAALSYTFHATQGAGLVLPDLPSRRKVLLAVRRDLSVASPAYPESARLFVGGTSPI